MDLPTSDAANEANPFPPDNFARHKSDSGQTSPQTNGTQVDTVPAHNMPTSNAWGQEPTTLGTSDLPNPILLTNFKHNATSVVLTVVAMLLLGVSIWFIYTEFINKKPVSAHLKLSTGQTITIVNVLSHLNIFLVALLLESAFESLRWSLASRNEGVSIATFLALSKATGFVGVADLLRVPGWHRFLCILKLLSKGLCLFLGLVLLINPIYTTIFTLDNSLVVAIVAGEAPLNGFSQVPPSVIDIYYQMYTKDILMDVTLVKSIAPITCSGPDCTSIFLPGGLDLVRLANGGPNATIFQEPKTSGPSTFIVDKAPGFHLEFFPIPVGWVFNQTTDCATYEGSNSEAIHICVAARGTQIYAGWSICPSDLFYLGLCLNNTSWKDQPDESTVLNIGKRYATVAYDIRNFSILSIESIGNPEPITATFISEAVGNLTKIFSLAFSSIPDTFTTTDQNFETYAASWSNFYMLSWALRLYQDDYRNYPGGPLDVLKSFLTIPIQFSTTAWQWASWDTLPPDLYTTGTYATSSSRVLGKFWVLIVFAAGAGSLILFSAGVLVWVDVWGPATPNSSKWPEMDTLAKSKFQDAKRSSGEESKDITVPDLERFSRQNGLGNGTSTEVRACIHKERVFVGASGGAVVLAMRGGAVEKLEAGQRYH